MLSFWHLVPSFFKRDFRLKKEANALRGGPLRLPRALSGREFGVHGSGADGLDRSSGRGSALLRQKGQTGECVADNAQEGVHEEKN